MTVSRVVATREAMSVLVGAGNSTALPTSVFKGSARRRSSAAIRLPTGKVAELEYLLGQYAQLARQPLQHGGHDRRLGAQHLPEQIGRHRRHGAARHGFDGGGARLAVDGGELAEHLAGIDVAERHLPAVLGKDRGVGLAGGEKQHRAGVLLVSEDLLVRLELAPSAAPGQDAPGLGRQTAKDINAIQRVVASLHDAYRLPRPTL